MAERSGMRSSLSADGELYIKSFIVFMFLVFRMHIVFSTPLDFTLVLIKTTCTKNVLNLHKHVFVGVVFCGISFVIP